MKKLIGVLLILCWGLFAFAQQTENYVEVMRTALNAEKKALIAEAMTFTTEEAELFWPLYTEYQNNLYTTNTKYLKIINEFAANFENMTDEVATDLMARLNSYDAEVLKLRKTYIKKFSKILPASKVLRYFQAENKIDILVDYEISGFIPLIEVE
ncbi:MAG: hypothetical protein R2750_02675 [Bacteroidales bacterium]